MENKRQSPGPLGDPGLLLSCIHKHEKDIPLRICVLVRRQPDSTGSWFVLLRETPRAQVYLGACCDADDRIQEWLEIWVQTTETADLSHSFHLEQLANPVFDGYWLSDYKLGLSTLPEKLIATGMETCNPSPVLIFPPSNPASPVAPAAASEWKLCTDNALLESSGLPAYSTSSFRYLYKPNPGAGQAPEFIRVSADGPSKDTQPLDALKTANAICVFNPHAGLIQVRRFCPLSLDGYLQVLEGGAWDPLEERLKIDLDKGVYASLQAWSANQGAMGFLMHRKGLPADRLNELFFLRLCILLEMFREVRRYIQAYQLPLLNLSDSSFGIHLTSSGDQFPAFWSTRCQLLKNGQAYPINISSSEQKYFVRLGKAEPSPYLPEGLGAHSFGLGSVRKRNVTKVADGVVFEGTLVAEDYLRPDPSDLLWFRLPLGQQKQDFYSHIYAAEALAHKEARFRTVPMKLPDEAVAMLQNTVSFAKAPYEIWPLMSSPCDLHSLGILAIRTLLSGPAVNFPVLVDDVLGFAKYVGEAFQTETGAVAALRTALERKPEVTELLSPSCPQDIGLSRGECRKHLHADLWLETMAWLLRLFPKLGPQSYCSDFGDVPSLALESVFDQPIGDLENLVHRLRSVLVPTAAANQEIASVVLEEMAAVS